MSTRVIWDPDTGQALYAGWALPGATTGEAAWRIARPLYVANELVGHEWANGSGAFDQVWDDRESLVYDANDGIPTTSVTVDVVPASGFPGTTFDLGFAIPDDADFYLNGGLMRRVGSFTGGVVTNEVIVTGSSFETALVLLAEDWFFVRVPL